MDHVRQLTVSVQGKEYNFGNTNEYQRVLLQVISQEQQIYQNMQSQGLPAEQQLKQQGVIEHYCRMLADYDGIEQIAHLWDSK